MRPEIRLEGLDQALSKISQAPARANFFRRQALRDGATKTRDAMRAKIYSRDGKAKRGVGYTFHGADEVWIGPRSKAALFSMRGRTPGRKAPPLSRIRKFLKAAGHEPTKTDVFLVARAIGRRGMRARPVAETAFNSVRGDLERLFADVLRRAFGR